MAVFLWVLVGLLLAGGLLTAYAGWRGAPYLPTPKEAVALALDMAAVGPGDVLVDVGAGDGRVVIAAAARGARAVGVELSPFLFAVAALRVWLARSRGTVRFGDALRADVSRATVLFLFLTPRTQPRIVRALASRVRPGTRILTYAFPIVGWRPDREERTAAHGTVRLYTVRSRAYV